MNFNLKNVPLIIFRNVIKIKRMKLLLFSFLVLITKMVEFPGLRKVFEN